MSQVEQLGNNKRIFKNTLMLFVRMLLIMGVTLYTSRVILDVLGVEDYGIYDIVAGIIVSFSFIQNSLSSATQRFLSFEMGRRDDKAVKEVYDAALIIHYSYAVIGVILLETLGLYFLNNVLKIPVARLEAANYAYQFIVATFAVSLLRIPSNAMIIAKERMSFYAIVSIVDVFLRLGSVFLLAVCPTDNLVTYTALLFLTSLIVNGFYYLFCWHQFGITPLTFNLNKERIKKLTSFCGWNILGGFTGVVGHEGPNFVLNVNMGVGINAAMGIAKQVSNAVYTFASNFQTAFNPQIVKLYSAGEEEKLNTLVYRSAMISYILISLVSFPLLYNMDFILSIWLKEVPAYSSQLCIYLIISQMIAALSSPLWMLAHAVGDIRNYQIVISIFNLITLPFALLVMYLGWEPQFVVFGYCVANIGILIYRIYYLKYRMTSDANAFMFRVVFKSLVITIITLFALHITVAAFEGWVSLLLSCVVSTLILTILFWFYCLSADERNMVCSYIKNKYLSLT